MQLAALRRAQDVKITGFTDAKKDKQCKMTDER
jgi:hypothetical protein